MPMTINNQDNLNTEESFPREGKDGGSGFFTNTDLFIAILGLALAITLFVTPSLGDEDVHAAAITSQTPPNPFDSVALEAQSAYVLDLTNGEVLYEKNADVSLPLASLTKMMTALTALSVVPQSTVITILKEDLELEGDSGLYANENWRLGDLLGLTLIESSNDGAYAVAGTIGMIEPTTYDRESARAAFIALMNEKAKELGLSQTYFLNSTGLDVGPDIGGGYGSARDTAVLIASGVKNYPEIFRATKYSSLKIESLNSLEHIAKNTNKNMDGVPVIIASKTGFTDLAGGNLAVVFDAGLNHHIAIAVLHSSPDGRFKDVEQLAWAAIDALVIKKSAGQ